MSIQIRLDAGALNALFPEGSQARVDLQACVIAEFTKKMFRQYMPDEAVKAIKREADKMQEQLTEGIRLARQDITQKAAIECGALRLKEGDRYNKPSVELAPDTIKKIRDNIAHALEGELDKQAAEIIQARVRQLTTIGGQYDRYIDLKVKEAVNAAVLQKVQQALG